MITKLAILPTAILPTSFTTALSWRDVGRQLVTITHIGPMMLYLLLECDGSYLVNLHKVLIFLYHYFIALWRRKFCFVKILSMNSILD